MNRVIWKFPISRRGGAEMPRGAEFLHFGLGRDFERDSDSFCIWALVDPNEPMVRVRYEIVPTGDDISDLLALGAVHRGTYVRSQGLVVWHLFEIPHKEGT